MNPGSWRVFTTEVFLTIGYEGFVKASMAITEEMLRKWGSADGLSRILWGEGPLEYLLPTLSNLLTTDSQESKALETIKTKQEPKVVPRPLPPPIPEPSGSERPSTPTQITPRFHYHHIRSPSVNE